jgi:calpain family cysteine protease/hemolysin type calcium-binding protein
MTTTTGGPPSWVNMLSTASIATDMAAADVGGTVTYAGLEKVFADLDATLTATHTDLTAAEFADLKAIAANLNNGMSTSTYLTDITQALVKGNASNRTWTGGTASSMELGNLAAGATATQLGELVGKWFLGTDLPSSSVLMSGSSFSVSYSTSFEPLFAATGPSMNDINQGYLGDCYLMSSLAEVACQNSGIISSMFTDNGNNTYGVKFYVDGTAEYVTVNASLADGGNIFNYGSGDIWASLAEKAYAQLQASDVVTGNSIDDGNSWSTIGNGGAPEMALEEITGASAITDFDASGSSWATVVYNSSFDVTSYTTGNTTASVLSLLEADFAQNHDVILSSSTNATDSSGKTTLVADHAMSIYGYDSATGMLEIRNPWGTEAGQTWDTTFEVNLSTLLADGDTITADNVGNEFYASAGDDTINSSTVDYSGLTTSGLVAIIWGGDGTVNKGGGNGTDNLTNIVNLIDNGTGRSNGDVFEVDAGENVTANSANFNFLIELTAGVNLAYGTNFTGITEFVADTGANTVNFANDPNFAYLFGSTGNDSLTLGSGGGYLFGEGGTNILNGGANATNFFEGGSVGTDTMNGGTGGASNFYFVDGTDQVNGAGAFNAMVELVSGVTVQLGSAQYQDVQEFVAGGGTNAVTVANTDSNFVYLYGGAGNDTLSTGSGGGYLFGESGTNVLTGGGGLNVFVADGASGVDTMNGGSGSNIYFIDAHSTVHGAGTFNTVEELQQNISLAYGSAQLGSDIQEVVLNGGTNTADFSADPNTIYLYGGAGNDTLFGGTGNDFLYGGLGTNTFAFQSGWGMDTIMDWTSGSNDQIDLTALSSLGVHAVKDLTQTITGGNDVITSSHTGTNSITLMGVGTALTASSFKFA